MLLRRMLGAVIVMQALGTCCRRKEEAHLMVMGPSYELYPNDTLPSDLQVTTWLKKGEKKRFIYSSPSTSLSLTLSTCTSPISWSFSPNTSIFTTSSSTTLNVGPSKDSPRTLEVFGGEAATFLHIYVSTEVGGPQTLRQSQSSRVKLLKKQKGKRLTVKWNPSLVDPQVTDYCLVISTQPFMGTLCSAQQKNETVFCTRRTHHTLTHLVHGQKYYLNIFATNHQSNFTYLYLNTSTIFNNEGRFRHTSLRDGKSIFANLKKLDGKAVFRFRITKNSTKTLDFFVIPCGGAVEVEVTLKDRRVVPLRKVEGFERITIAEPQPYAKYYVKIFALNKEELLKTSGVEVYATTRYPLKVPIPSMPHNLKITEYKSLATCNSVTVGWMTAPSQKNVHYCVSAKKGKIRDLEEYKLPNQCGLESRLKKSTNFVVKICKDLKYTNESVVTKQIGSLKPGRSYIIQVTAKKPMGKTLSYDLLQVRTKPNCRKKD